MKLTNLIHYKELDSTQSEIWRLIEKNNIEDGTVVVADIQTAGKGTHGRKWYTDEPNNIAFSIYIETDCDIEKLQGITIDIAKDIVYVFKKYYNIELDIKEPNDLIINNKKIGGILTESKIHGNITKYLVIGIGINTSKMNFPEDIKDIATSIKKEYGIDVNPIDFVKEFCNKFEETIKRRI